jgi:negative regulator of flagellin synthesis FlgM
MQIYGPAHLHGPQSVGSPHSVRAIRPNTSVESKPIQDEVNISDTARLVEQVKQAPDIRADRVQALRTQIANGTYDTSGKNLEVAISRLLDEIG